MTQNDMPFSTRIRLLAPAVLAAFAFASSAAVAQEPSPTLMEAGVWVNDVGDGAVELYICQDKASRLCGRIVWLKEPLNAEGVPKHDRYNPKPEMQNRPICGLPVLGNLARDSEGGFDSGWIYDPKAGKSYSAAVRLSSRDKLTVTGYLGMKFMGKSFVWTRAPADLKRCDGAPGAQPTSTKPAAKPTTPGTSAAATPSKPKAPTASAAAAGTAKATTASKTTTASKPTAGGSTATAQKPSTAKAAAAENIPKPKPAQKPVKAVANTNAAAQPTAAPPAAKPAPKPVQEADDTATSWPSGQ